MITVINYISLKKYVRVKIYPNCLIVSAISTTCSKKEFTETRSDLVSSAVKEATRLFPETERDLLTRDLAGSVSTLREL